MKWVGVYRMHKNNCWMRYSLKYLNELLMFHSFDLFYVAKKTIFFTF